MIIRSLILLSTFVLTATAMAQSTQGQDVIRTKMPGEAVVSFKSAVHGTDLSARLTSWDMDASGLPISSLTISKLLEWQRPGETLVTNVSVIRYSGSTDPDEVVKYLNSKPDVEWASPNYQCTGDVLDYIPNDPDYGNQYHHPLMNNPAAWDITLGSSTVIMGITDDGVQTSHPDLSANIWSNPGEIQGNGIDDDSNGYIDDHEGWDFIDDDNTPSPNSAGNDHGTHVAGICGGDTDNGTGIAGTAGAATIMPIKFYDPSQAWTSTIIAAAFAYGIDNGARILNTSYNINGWVGDPTFTAGLQYYYDNGGLHFNSAGNGGQLNPARQAFHQSLLVINTTSSDVKSGSSNYGTGCDLCAPGSSILSTVTNSGYGTKSGTSMAAPNAAGAAALIWSANPTWTREQVAAQLLATCDNIDAQNPGLEGLLGAGRVNTGNALTATIPAPRISLVIDLPEELETISIGNGFAFTLGFDQIMEPATVNNPDAFKFQGAGSDNTFDTGDDVFLSMTWTPYLIGTNRLNFELSETALCQGTYRIVANAQVLTNPFGTALDGDSDGTGGDSWTRTFLIDAIPLPQILPLGSLASATSQNSVIGENGGVSKFCFELGPDQSISAVASPKNALATLKIFVTTDAGVAASDTLTAAGPGMQTAVPVDGLDGSGIYLLNVESDLATDIEVELVRNGMHEAQVLDAADGQELNIDPSYIELGSGRRVLVGANPGLGYQLTHGNNAALFVDISATGVGLGLGDDSEATITSTVGNALLSAGNVTVANNGGVLAGAGQNLHYVNDPLPSTEFVTALFPFWDDIDSETGDVYWEERVINGINALVVQWEDRPHYNGIGMVTFQLQLFESGPVLARYAYADVDFGNASYNNGLSATVGAQQDTSTAQVFSLNTASLANGDYIDITTLGAGDIDEYELDLTGLTGTKIDIILKGQQGADYSGQSMALLDTDGSTVLATATPDPLGGTPVLNFDLAIIDYMIPADGIYTIRTNSAIAGTYAVVITQGLCFDTEVAGDLAVRDVTHQHGALGHLKDGGGDAVDRYRLFLQPGDTIQVSTTTPFDDPVGGNTLDPRIELFDPGMVMVAADDNSAPDGKNAFLPYWSQSGGAYVVEVQNVAGTGEYVLHVETGNCPKNRIIDITDGPITGDYHALYSIRLMSDAVLEPNSEINLFAPITYIDSTFDVPLGNVIEVKEEGCAFFDD